MFSRQRKGPCRIEKLSTQPEHLKALRRRHDLIRTLRIFSACAGARKESFPNAKYQDPHMMFTRMRSIGLMSSESGNIGNVLWPACSALVSK